jgi:hypothetical protein
MKATVNESNNPYSDQYCDLNSVIKLLLSKLAIENLLIV